MKNKVLICWIFVVQAFSGLAQVNHDQNTTQQKSGLKTAVGSSRLKLLIQLSRAYLKDTSETKASSDSARVYARKAEMELRSLRGEPLTGETYLLLTEISSENMDLKEGKKYGKKAVEYFDTHGPKDKLAESYLALEKNYETYDAELKERIRICEKAVAVYHSLGMKKEEADALNYLAYDFMCIPDWTKSLQALNKALALYKSVNYRELQSIYSLIGVVHQQTGNFPEALKFGLEAVRTVEALNDSSIQAADIYNYVSITYSTLMDHKKAEEFMRKAYAIAEKKKSVFLILQLANNIAQVLNYQNKPREGFLFLQQAIKKYPTTDTEAELNISARLLGLSVALKDMENAAVYSKRLIEASSKFSPESARQLLVYLELAKYYMAIEQYKNAEKYLVAYEKIATQNRAMNEIVSVHRLFFKLYSAQKKYEPAIEHLVLHKKYSDSVFQNNRSKEISELQVKYEMDKKEKDITLLTKQSLLQKTELQQASLIRNVTFGGVALMLIIIGLLFNRYRLKQRSNEQLEAQQKKINQKNVSLQQMIHEKEWLLREVHHRVKNNLQTVMSLLNSQSAYLQNDAALSAIQDSKHRVHAMSLIHQKLYGAQNVATIDMSIYIHELVGYMRDCFNTGSRIRFEMNVESLELDVSQAVPLGLILNEGITNAIKYAFPNDTTGLVSITLKHSLDNHYTLVISDNGVGMPANCKPGASSLGMSLMKGLSEDLEGSFTLESNAGTTITVSFIRDVLIKQTQTFSVDDYK